MSNLPAIVFALRTGGDYLPEHVDAFIYQVEKNTTVAHEVKCYSDIKDEKYISLEKNYPGWWSCTELWRNIGPTIVVGLDTLVFGSLDPLFELALRCKPDEFYLLDSPFHKG